MPTELPKQYDPKEAQEKWLKFWNERGYFHSDPVPGGLVPGRLVRGSAAAPGTRHQTPGTKPYTIVIPPPNVTGALHMGHALNNTLQDVLIRWRRMQGFNTLWMPGTDHAGIATQAVVERLIFQQEKKTRHDLGREELVKRIWQWRDHYENRILTQLKQLGCSCDWRRTRFTLDEMCSRAVRQTFFDFFKAGLIFRGKRLVNWDTQLQTSVADDETYTEDTNSGFWTFKYAVLDDSGRPTAEHIRFSTTRPETMLGDTAICVHPKDERYLHLHGKKVQQPLTDRTIPIIVDGQLADPTLGTGCVKVTPAHDPNDYACFQRNPEIGIINILNPDGTINEHGGRFKGLDRYKARDEVTKAMEALGLFEGKEERIIPLKFSDRSKTPIEPYLSDQWFVKMGDASSSPSPLRGGGQGEGFESPTPSPPTPLPRSGGEGSKIGLAQMAMDAVTSGRVKIHPERYAKTYLDWLGEKRDWCISRQLWWGHRIPVWRVSVLFHNMEGPALVDLDDKLIEWERRGRIARNPREEMTTVGGSGPIPGAANWFVCLRDPNDREVIDGLKAAGFEEDPDVLDTWFSSALWPHSTLGWPEQTPELKYYYPTDVLVTSRGIITLWVARMVLAGLFNVGEVPFHDVYITPTILDGFGETMSKSKGNGVDPLDIIARYGTDALRFHMAHIATENQDSRMPVANVCPHCDTLIPVKQEHMYMRTRKVACPNCKQPLRPGGPWPTEDPELKTAKQASEAFEQGRNFANKLWNAARFILMNLDGYTAGAIPPPTPPSKGGEKDSSSSSKGWEKTSSRVSQEGERSSSPSASLQRGEQSSSPPYEGGVGGVALPIEDRWILSRLAATTAAVTEHLEAFHFSDAARTLYDFTWSEFCDWYVEMAKSRLKRDGETGGRGEGETGRVLAQRVLVGVLDTILKLLHPIMPFVTESIWQALNDAVPERGLLEPGKATDSVMIAPWPQFSLDYLHPASESRIARMQELVRAVRNIRNQFGVVEKASVDVTVRCCAAVAQDFELLTPFILPLAKAATLNCGAQIARPPQSATFVHAEFEAYVHLQGLIDVDAETKRLEKQRADKERQLQGVRAKLGNASFVDRAPAEVVQQQRQSDADLVAQLKAIDENLKQLKQA